MRNTRLSPLLAIGLAGIAHAGGWTVAEDGSSVGFTAEQQGSKFSGKFSDFSAAIAFDPSAPASGSVMGTVSTDSVDTRDYDRDGRLVEPDWFDTANFPEAKFESESIEATDDGKFVAHGQLTLKGQTKPIDMTFSFDQNGGAAKFTGKMTIDRFEYEVGRGWNDTYMVGQNVEVNINLNLTR